MAFGLVAALVAAGGAAQAQDWHYYFDKQRMPLVLDETAVVVIDKEHRPLQAVENYLRAVGMADYSAEPFVQGTVLMRRPAGLVGMAPAAEIIETITQRPDNPFFLSPVFRFNEHVAFVPPSVLVRFNEGVPRAYAEHVIRTVGRGEPLQENWAGMGRAYWVDPRTKSGVRALEAANRLAEDPDVEWGTPGLISTAGPSGCLSAPTAPDDEYFSQSWWLHNPYDTAVGAQVDEVDVNAPEAWSVCGGSPEVKIAIIDNGADKNHEDLNVALGADCVQPLDPGAPPRPCTCDDLTVCGLSRYDPMAGGHKLNEEAHGTMVAGVATALMHDFPLAGSGMYGTTGMAPGLSLVVIRTFEGESGYNPRNVAAALDWALQVGVRVTNNSWNRYSLFDSAEKAQYEETRAAGMIHFSSAGDEDQSVVFWPAELPTVNAVSAVDRTGSRWHSSNNRGSNYGPQNMISAPGAGILSTDRSGLTSGYSADPDVVCVSDGNYCTDSGTSYASPMVAAVAGLILSMKPTLSPDEVESILCATAQDLGPPGWDEETGCGLVDAGNAAAWIFGDGFESGSTSAWSSVVTE